MNPLHNIEFIILFDQIRFLGKVSSVITKVNSEIKIEKYFDVQQLMHHDFSDNNKVYVLVSENEYLVQLEDFDISASQFNSIICIDKEEITLEFDVIFLNQKLILTGLMTRVNDLILSYLPEKDFIPTHNKNIIIGKSYPCDLFIKLSEEKYVKILSKEEMIVQEFKTKYLAKSINYFYIRNSDYNDFTKTAFRKKTIFKKREEEVDATIDAIEALHSYTKEFGISEKIVKQTKMLHEQIEKNATSKIVKGLLGKLKNLEGSFLYNHSYVTATIALTAGKKFNWFTFKNQEKIYMGSMFHDLGYKNEKNALNEMLGKNEIKKLPFDQQEDILNHCTRFAHHLASEPGVHQDVINIILRHHGAYGDESYPKAINPNEVTLIFALFMLSHDFTTQLYKIAFNKNKIPTIIENLKAQYKVGNYKSVLPEFISSIEETFLNN